MHRINTWVVCVSLLGVACGSETPRDLQTPDAAGTDAAGRDAAQQDAAPVPDASLVDSSVYDPLCEGCRADGMTCELSFNCMPGSICNLPDEELYDPNEPSGVCIRILCSSNDDCE